MIQVVTIGLRDNTDNLLLIILLQTVEHLLCVYSQLESLLGKNIAMEQMINCGGQEYLINLLANPNEEIYLLSEKITNSYFREFIPA